MAPLELGPVYGSEIIVYQTENGRGYTDCELRPADSFEGITGTVSLMVEGVLQGPFADMVVTVPRGATVMVEPVVPGVELPTVYQPLLPDHPDLPSAVMPFIEVQPGQIVTQIEVHRGPTPAMYLQEGMPSYHHVSGDVPEMAEELPNPLNPAFKAWNTPFS